MMEKEVVRRKREVQTISALGTRVDEMMGGLGRGGGGVVDEGGGDRKDGMGGVGKAWDEEEMRKEKERRIFDALDSIDIG